MAVIMIDDRCNDKYHAMRRSLFGIVSHEIHPNILLSFFLGVEASKAVSIKYCR